MTFKPNFIITPKIAKALMKIEALKETTKMLPITPEVMKTLRETTRLQSAHYSTRIEGNRLSQEEVEQVIKKHKHFPGRQRDEKEIKGYYSALEWLENNLEKPLGEVTIRKIHALIENGGNRKIKPTGYRDGQNVIKDSVSGTIIYLPPEAKDVPVLMTELVEWIESEKSRFPCPIVAAVAHYQFVTIHPYYDGNGRTARLLTTAVLHRGGYGLRGLYSLEEYYAQDLQSYYNAISRGEHHNYYFGRAEADITPWIEYFAAGMLDAFEHVAQRLEEARNKGSIDRSGVLRTLTPKQRKVLTLFAAQATITSKDIAVLFGFSMRSARLLCRNLVGENFLTTVNEADKTRSYKLKSEYENLIN
jgi:Fic family protein